MGISVVVPEELFCTPGRWCRKASGQEFLLDVVIDNTSHGTITQECNELWLNFITLKWCLSAIMILEISDRQIHLVFVHAEKLIQYHTKWCSYFESRITSRTFFAFRRITWTHNSTWLCIRISWQISRFPPTQRYVLTSESKSEFSLDRISQSWR